MRTTLRIVCEVLHNKGRYRATVTKTRQYRGNLAPRIEAYAMETWNGITAEEWAARTAAGLLEARLNEDVATEQYQASDAVEKFGAQVGDFVRSMVAPFLPRGDA